MKLMISGQMRSGTTFLANLLDHQAGMAVLADFLHIGRLREEARVDSLDEPLTPAARQRVVDRFTGVSAGDGLRAISAATSAEFAFDLDPDRFESLLDFYVGVLEQVKGPGHVLAGHKTTCAEHVFEELLRRVADLRIVYMVRDPRDVLVSNRRMMAQHPSTILRNWVEGVDTLGRLRRDPALRRRLFVLRYEDLMRRPGRSLGRLARFLGTGRLSLPDRLEWYGQPFVANSSFDDIERPFDTRGIGRWRTAGPALPLLACLIAGTRMHRLGYRTPWATRARAALVQGRRTSRRLAGIADWLRLPSADDLERACAA